MTGKELGLTAVRGQLLMPGEIAPFLRVSERWVREKMQKGTFPIRWYPVGERDRLVDSADLNDWLVKIRAEKGTAELPNKAKREIQKKEVIA